MGEITVGELALLWLLLKKVPNASPRHLMALLCILRQKSSYLSLEEIEESSLIGNGKLKRIMKSLAKKRIVQKEGCLYKKPKSEKIVEII